MPAMPIAWLRAHYVLVYAILGALLPYLSLYAKGQGLSDTQVGWVLAVFGLAVIIAPPVYTAMADYWRNNRRIIAACYGFGAAMLLLLGVSTTFPAILLAHLAFALAFTALIPLLDALTFATILGPGDEPADRAAHPTQPPRAAYRTIRVWGSFGFMIPGVGFASIIAFLPLDAPTVARVAVLTGAGFGAIGLLACRNLPAYQAASPLAGRMPTTAAFRALTRPALATFIASVFLLFISITMYYAFYPPYLEDLGVDAEFVGLVTNLGVGVEVFFMVGAGALLRKIGLRGIMVIGIAAHLARMLLLAAVPHPVTAIATQVFHGPTVLALYLLPPMYINHRAEPAYRNSMQGLYAMACLGVARVIGAGTGGSISDAIGGGNPGRRLTFAVAAGLALIALTVFLAAFRDEPDLAEKKV
jgi:PPP family 3-phenylpropionic acid transporter